MTTHCCTTAARHARRSAPWVAPTAVLLLTPKCPLCLAAYIAAATGVSMSLSAAGLLRTGMIVGSVAALLCLTTIAALRWWRGQRCTCAGAPGGE